MRDSSPPLPLSYLDSSLEESIAPQFPGRVSEMNRLELALFPRPRPCPVWVWGGQGTGKTALVRALMHRREGGSIRWAYVDGLQWLSGKTKGVAALLGCILNQLARHAMGSDTDWKPWKECASLEEFEKHVVALAAAEGVSLYVVFDHMDDFILQKGADKDLVVWMMTMLAEPHLQEVLGLVFIARRDWNGCAVAPVESTTVLDIHFGAYSTECLEKILQLQDPRRVVPKKSLPPERARWSSHIAQSLTNCDSLLGVANISAIYQDGFAAASSPSASAAKSATASTTTAAAAKKSDPFHAVQPYIRAILSQDAEKILAGGELPAASPLKRQRSGSLAQQQRGGFQQDFERGERMKLVSVGVPNLSQPRYESAMLVAAFLASRVDKRRDAQIFSEEQFKTKQRNTVATVGTGGTVAAGAQKRSSGSQSFHSQRLLSIFRHVIDDYHYTPCSLWWNTLQSLIDAGNLKRIGPESRLHNLSLKCCATLEVVSKLATEIGYSHLEDVLEAQ